MSAFETRRTSVESFVRREDGRGSSADLPLSEATPVVTDSPPPPDQPESVSVLKSTAVPAVVGGLAGAVLAVVTVLAMTELSPALDPRLPGLAQQVSGFQQSLYTLESAVRGTETDLVRALEADTALAARLDEQSAGFDTAMTDIAEARRQLQIETGPGSVVFGVSVVQLADAVAGGRPFENEWVNLHALTAGNEPLRESLRRLMPVASLGVPTLADLQAGLRATAAVAGTPVVDPNSLYLYSLNLVQSGLGLPIGTTTERQVIGGLVTEADQRLAAGDLAGALAVLANLTEDTAAPFAAWLEQARRRAVADAVVAEFARVSKDALQARAKTTSG